MHQSTNKLVYLLQRLLELFTLYYLEFILLSMHLENLLCLDNIYPLGEDGFSKQAERFYFCRVSNYSSTCPKHLIQEKLRRHPGQMPKAPKLTRFKAKEQDLYSELLMLSPLYVVLLSNCRITGRYPNVAHVPYTLAPKTGRWIDRQLCTNQQTDGLTNHQKGRQMFRQLDLKITFLVVEDPKHTHTKTKHIL